MSGYGRPYARLDGTPLSVASDPRGVAVYPELLLTRRGAALPDGYAPAAERGDWMVALQGAVPSATLESARTWVLGDPLLRGGDSRETAVRFLEAASRAPSLRFLAPPARGDAERFLKDRVLGNFVLCHAERDRIHLYSSAAGL